MLVQLFLIFLVELFLVSFIGMFVSHSNLLISHGYIIYTYDLIIGFFRELSNRTITASEMDYWRYFEKKATVCAIRRVSPLF